MLEIKWHPVTGYEGLYEITEQGFIRSLGKRYYHQILNQRVDRGGYVAVRLTKDGKTTTEFVHRLLAQTFIPNPDNKAEVNHINGVKTDNSLTNLEWATHSENIRHAYRSGLYKTDGKQCRVVVDMCTGEMFFSIKHASEKEGINYEHLQKMLAGIKENPTCLKYLN